LAQHQQQQQQQQQQQYQQSRNLQTPDVGGGVSCPEPNGRFPLAPQCDAYIECIDGVGEEKLCPEGLLFNPEARFNYPCGYPIDVQCLGRSALREFFPLFHFTHMYYTLRNNFAHVHNAFIAREQLVNVVLASLE
jgi:hypothetical protein